MSLLDTVEPDGYRMFDGEGSFDFREELPDQASIEWSARYGRKWEPLYSRETVESLLAENRKQVLLEAAERLEKILRNETRAGAAVVRKPLHVRVPDELRRMASEPIGNALEGEKE